MRIIGLKANDKDNVATIFYEVNPGDIIAVMDKAGNEEEIKSHENIPYGHKIAIKEIKKGDDIIKYGESIGVASINIERTDYVHIHNLDSKRGRGDLNN